MDQRERARKYIGYLDPVGADGLPILGELERGVGLLDIGRFHAIPEMAQRTTVFDHSLRVTAGTYFFSEMAVELGVPVDQNIAWYYADHHDDSELVTDDIPTPVKQKASPALRAVMRLEEAAAEQQIARLVRSPFFIPSFEEAMAEYRRQESVAARLVNYVDKFDGLHEAMHEVITGTNKDGFKQVISEYEPSFAKLKDKNKDWQEAAQLFLPPNFFDFPNPDTLTPKSIKDVDFTSIQAVIQSLSDGNPASYKTWLAMSVYAFGLGFFERTFPFWQYAIPKAVTDDLARVGEEGIRKPSPLVLPEHYTRARRTLGETILLTQYSILDEITERAQELRLATGRRPAPPEFFLGQPVMV